MINKNKILIIEDEASLRMILEYDLAHYQLDFACDGKEGLEKLENNNYDLAIIDWKLPYFSGIEIIKKIRQTNNDIKIIMVTSMDNEMDIVEGLETGANDYITKPYSTRELQARIRVLLKDKNKEIIKVNDIEIYLANRTIYQNNQEIKISKLEFDLLIYLIKNTNRIVTRDMIYDNIWNEDDIFDIRVIDNHISNIKRKLSLQENIITKRGVGYFFVYNK